MAFALGLLLVTLWVAPAVAAEAKRVLVVHSFGSAAPPFTTHSTAFEATLTEEMGEPVDLDEVSLGMDRYAHPDMEEAFVQFLLKRLSKWRPHLVAPVGSPAGRFVAKYRERLFPGTPIVYTGMDRRTLSPGDLGGQVTFVGERFDLPGLVEDILQLQPDTDHIAVVIGASPLERYWKEVFRREFARFDGRIRFTWLDGLSFEQMLGQVAVLPPRSFILLALLLRDARGVTYNQDAALLRLHAVANAPINGLFQHQLGLGIVGGRLYQAELEGVEAARIAIQVLRGAPVSSFPEVIIEAQKPRYDWRELRRWNIGEDRLPPGSTVEYRRPTMWQQYWMWIVGALAIGTLQAGLIVQLGMNLVRRRRAERALRESEERFRTVADSAPVLIWMADGDRRCTFFNKPWLDFTGRTPEQEMGDGWAEGVHPDDLTRVREAYAEAFDRRRPFDLEFRLRRHDGEYRWVRDHGVPRYDARGGFAGYIGSCSDVTERLRAEERLRQVFETAPNPMLIVDGRGEIVLANAQVEAVFGYTRDEVMGRAVEMLVPQLFRSDHAAWRADYARKPEARLMGGGRTLFGLRKDGTDVPVEVGLNPISTAEGLLVVVSIIDISERRRAEMEAQELRQELAHISRVATIGELTAAIVHQLSQPLTAIRTNAEAGRRLIASGKQSDNELSEILEDIVGADARAGQVIQHMRTLFRKGMPERRPLLLNTLINDVISLVGGDARLKNVAIDLDLAPGLPLLQGDRVQLQQVMLNLLVNAFDAMAVGSERPRRLIVRTRALEPSSVQLEVVDTGVGIAAEVLKTIFEPFVTTKVGGMGMGLSVSRSIVRAHEGEIYAENRPEGGAVFRVVLPAISAASATTSAPAP